MGVVSSEEVLKSYPDLELRHLFNGSQKVFDEIASRKLARWVVTFSGGKDSTLTTLLTVDYLSYMSERPQVDVVYSDTLVEIPEMRRTADSLLRHVRRISRERGLPVATHVVTPRIEDRFWVRMLGRGYPPPKPMFRWCTGRLKIAPAMPLFNSKDPTAVITGVRYGESTKRTGRLIETCSTGGECGQDYWAQKGPTGSGITYFAPIIEWRTCKVWDFLHFVAPQSGWPTNQLYELYGDTRLRFGCWTCTLVPRDKTAEELINRNPQSPLVKLHELREYIYSEAKNESNRWMRNGHIGPLTLDFRRKIMTKLLGLQQELNSSLISEEEIDEIYRLWRSGYGVPPKSRPRNGL